MFSVVVRAPIVAAIVASRSDGIARSCFATMNYEGFFFQAGEMAERPSALTEVGPWVAVTRCRSISGRHCAKSRSTPMGSRVTKFAVKHKMVAEG